LRWRILYHLLHRLLHHRLLHMLRVLEKFLWIMRILRLLRHKLWWGPAYAAEGKIPLVAVVVQLVPAA
jgi:hypothetical protein